MTNITLFYYFLVSLATIFCITIIVLWWQRKSLEKLRCRIARDLHDDLGSSLSNISLLTALVSKELSNDLKSRAQEFLNRISVETNKIHDSISDAVTVLGSSCRKLGNLAALLNRHGYELLQEKGVIFSLFLPQGIKETSIAASHRRDLYLILKEALHNAMRHSGASEVKIVFWVKYGRLYCNVKDNGCGFNLLDPKKGNGLNNMARRAAIIKSDLVINSAPGKGCEILLILPLHLLWLPHWLKPSYKKALIDSKYNNVELLEAEKLPLNQNEQWSNYTKV